MGRETGRKTGRRVMAGSATAWAGPPAKVRADRDRRHGRVPRGTRRTGKPCRSGPRRSAALARRAVQLAVSIERIRRQRLAGPRQCALDGRPRRRQERGAAPRHSGVEMVAQALLRFEAMVVVTVVLFRLGGPAGVVARVRRRPSRQLVSSAVILGTRQRSRKNDRRRQAGDAGEKGHEGAKCPQCTHPFEYTPTGILQIYPIYPSEAGAAEAAEPSEAARSSSLVGGSRSKPKERPRGERTVASRHRRSLPALRLSRYRA